MCLFGVLVPARVLRLRGLQRGEAKIPVGAARRCEPSELLFALGDVAERGNQRVAGLVDFLELVERADVRGLGAFLGLLQVVVDDVGFFHALIPLRAEL